MSYTPTLEEYIKDCIAADMAFYHEAAMLGNVGINGYRDGLNHVLSMIAQWHDDYDE